MQVERESGFGHEYSGARVSNTWVICLEVWDNPGKLGLIPNTLAGSNGLARKVFSLREEPAAYQLVGGVMAYQGNDG